ncbi:HD domain-containing protein [Parasphingorhabdus sp.]|uniref:HD domain-containing protein n=1 Tax=Parasphingorhabdus sp. TaxID=2709688 RepID=UPI0032630B20
MKTETRYLSPTTDVYSALGTAAWARRTNGVMSPEDKEVISRQNAEMRRQEKQAIEAIKAGSANLLDFDVENLVIPDSAMAKAAEEYAQDVYSTPLNLHCLRTYAWGSLVGRVEGLSPDPELMYVSAVLHDLGLTEPHIHEAPRCCFAVVGAREAKKFVSENGWEEPRAEKVYDIVSLHLNSDISASDHGPEARLVGAGAHFDVFGRHYHRLSASTIDSVLKAYPREGFLDDLFAHVGKAEHHADSRNNFLLTTDIRDEGVENPLDLHHT